MNKLMSILSIIFLLGLVSAEYQTEDSKIEELCGSDNYKIKEKSVNSYIIECIDEEQSKSSSAYYETKELSDILDFVVLIASGIVIIGGLIALVMHGKALSN